MNSTITLFVGAIVQVTVAMLQIMGAVVFVYRWQRNSWRFTNIMKIREPLARAYCSLSAVVRARHRVVEDAADETKAGHDKERVHHYLTATQQEIVNFSVEHFKARFWMTDAENRQLDVLFDKLREAWNTMRSPAEGHDELLDDLRREIMKFDEVCNLRKHGGGQWAHVALHP